MVNLPELVNCNTKLSVLVDPGYLTIINCELSQSRTVKHFHYFLSENANEHNIFRVLYIFVEHYLRQLTHIGCVFLLYQSFKQDFTFSCGMVPGKWLMTLTHV